MVMNELLTWTCNSKPVPYSAYHRLALRELIQAMDLDGYKARIRARKTAACLPLLIVD